MKPGEHKTVQARILGYAEAIGWALVSREEAERRRGFDPDVPPADRARNRSLFFDDLLDAKVREFNPRYLDAEGALLGQFRQAPASPACKTDGVFHAKPATTPPETLPGVPLKLTSYCLGSTGSRRIEGDRRPAVSRPYVKLHIRPILRRSSQAR